MKYKLFFGFSAVEDGNMDFRFGPKEQVISNRLKYFKKQGVDPEKTVVMKVNFGNDGLVVGEKNLSKGVYDRESAPEVDILITKQTGVNLAVLTADCIPLILFSEEKGVLLVLHLGTENILRGTLKAALQKANDQFGDIQFKSITGPFLKVCHYDFQLSSLKAEREKIEMVPQLLRMKDGQTYLDLESALAEQLKDEGISDFEIDSGCTFEEHFSHHRSYTTGEAEARFLTYARLVSS